MDPEVKRELEEMRALVRDNHRMLKSMIRHQWYGLMFRIVIWIIVLAIPLYLYQEYVSPSVGALTGTTTPAQSSIFGFPSPAQIERMIETYREQ